MTMAPQPYPAFTQSLPNNAVPLQPPEFSPTSLSSPSSGTITNIVFGLCALLIGVITIYQAHKAWSIWRAHHPPGSHVPGGTTPAQVDVELGHPYTPPPIEDQDQGPDRDDPSYIVATGTKSNDAAAASLPTDDREPVGLSSFSNEAPSTRFSETLVSPSTEPSKPPNRDNATISTPVSPPGRRPVVEDIIPGVEGLGSPVPGGT